MSADTGLLTADDPAPVSIVNPGGESPFLFIGDHAGDVIPSSLGTLGVSERNRARHIAIDIGVAALGPALAERLDAVFIRQTYSRLVIDCNRDPAAPRAIWEVSDGTVVPGNTGIDAADRARRVAAIHAPYQRAIAGELARRDAAGQPTILVALHSFTATMAGIARPWHAGILRDGGDDGFALALLHALRGEPDLVVGDNEPYRMDEIDYTIPYHAYPARLPYAEIEIRQDLIADAAGIEQLADRLARLLPAARDAFGERPARHA